MEFYGFNENGGSVFATETCHLSSPISRPGTQRCIRHTTLHTMAHDVNIRHQGTFWCTISMPQHALAYKMKNTRYMKISTISALDKLCETGQSKPGTSPKGSGATLVASPSPSSQVPKMSPYQCFLICHQGANGVC